MAFFFFRLAQRDGLAFSNAVHAEAGSTLGSMPSPPITSELSFNFWKRGCRKATWGTWNIMEHIARDILHFFLDGRTLKSVVFSEYPHKKLGINFRRAFLCGSPCPPPTPISPLVIVVFVFFQVEDALETLVSKPGKSSGEAEATAAGILCVPLVPGTYLGHAYVTT